MSAAIHSMEAYASESKLRWYHVYSRSSWQHYLQSCIQVDTPFSSSLVIDMGCSNRICCDSVAHPAQDRRKLLLLRSLAIFPPNSDRSLFPLAQKQRSLTLPVAEPPPPFPPVPARVIGTHARAPPDFPGRGGRPSCSRVWLDDPDFLARHGQGRTILGRAVGGGDYSV